jgi:hypothetical protein
MSLQMSQSDHANTMVSRKGHVALRNKLVHHFVHHFIDEFDLSMVGSCVRAQDYLIEGYLRIDGSFEKLCTWMRAMPMLKQ